MPIPTWLNPSGVDAGTAAADQIDVAIGSVDELEALRAAQERWRPVVEELESLYAAAQKESEMEGPTRI